MRGVRDGSQLFFHDQRMFRWYDRSMKSAGSRSGRTGGSVADLKNSVKRQTGRNPDAAPQSLPDGKNSDAESRLYVASGEVDPGAGIQALGLSGARSVVSDYAVASESFVIHGAGWLPIGTVPGPPGRCTLPLERRFRKTRPANQKNWNSWTGQRPTRGRKTCGFESRFQPSTVS